MAFVRQASWIENGPNRPRPVVYRRAGRGVGMYPDQICFDPSRPSWLPYWVDTWGESTCKYQNVIFGTAPGVTVVHGPPPSDGSVPPTTVYTADASSIDALQKACAINGGTWDAALGVCNDSFLTQAKPYLIAGGVGLGVLLVLGVLGGRR